MKRNDTLIGILVLILLSAIAYLPLLGRQGYTHDDWYLMYSAGAYGPGVFREIFSVDRPGRIFVMIPAYLLFGDNPLYYNISAYIFRVIGGLALLGTLNLLWARRKVMITAMALLFLIYPGFLSQPNAIDYQSHIVGLAAALLSIYYTLKAVLSENLLKKIVFHTSSILLGWLYLSQMEWYISFEFFRWACVFILASRMGGTLLQKLIQTIKWAYPTVLVTLAFLIWRLFFFVSERGATDVDVQFEDFRLYPLQTIYHWGLQVLQDLYDVMLAAWVIPLSQLRGAIEPWGVLAALVAVGLIMIALFRFGDDFSGQAMKSNNMQREALWLGLSTAIVGLIVIAMVNRDVSYPSYSRYVMVSSVGVAIFLVALLGMISWRVARYSGFALLVTISLLTHHANSVMFARETAAMRDFWWQVSWRIPQLEPRTTLIGNYPIGVIEEDYFIWGPANLIYYPEKGDAKNIVPSLFAALLNDDTVTKVIAQERQEFDNRKNIITYKNYRNILILNQPTLSSCVHVLNGLQPEYSSRELDSIREIGSFSEIEHVQVNEAPHTPPTIVFGHEPDHDWCYYYQKADLARQQGDWDEVLRLRRAASEKGLAPNDPIEWMPFLQAYVYAKDANKLAELAPSVTEDTRVARQACQILTAMPNVDASVTNAIKSFYCVQ